MVLTNKNLAERVKTILGLDLGEKRVGAAISHSGILAQSIDTIEYKSEKELLIKLNNLIQKNKIELMVIGLPISFSRIKNQQVKKIEKIIKKIKHVINIPIILEDETLTSKIAKDNLSHQKKKKQDIDAESARIILQSYLDKSKDINES